MKANMQTLSEFPKSSIAQTLQGVNIYREPVLILTVLERLQNRFAEQQQRIQERKAILEALI